MRKNILYCEIFDLINYKNSLKLQEKLFYKLISIKRLKNKNSNWNLIKQNFIIYCQHPDVYTIGKSTINKSIEIPDLSIPIYKINRGGDITLHNPGQLVVYFILDLDEFGENIISFVRKLEVIIKKILEKFDIESHTIQNKTGVWIKTNSDYQKICSIGLRVRNGITMHGLSLNINNDLKNFDFINPCGMNNINMCSISEILKKKIEVKTIIKLLSKIISEQFNSEISLFNNY